MRKPVICLLLAVICLAVPLAACSPAAPEAIEPNYTNAAWGLSMSYPEDWIYEEGESGVKFATSEQLITGEESESGASMSVEVGSDGWGPGSEGVCALLVMFFAEADVDRWDISDPQPRTIGGQDGCAITFECKLEGVKGFVAGTVCEGWLYLLWGASALDEWPEHGPDLQAMLDSVHFTAAPARTPTPLPTPTSSPVAESAERMTELARWEAEGSAFSVAFASGWALEHTVRLWRVSDGELLQTLHGHTMGVNTVSFSPDGETLASGSSDSTVRLWRVSDGQLLQTLDVDPGGVFVASCVAFSPDWQTLATGSSGGPVQLWDMSDGELLQTLSGHMYTVKNVAFSPDGETLASTSSSGGVQLCKVSDGVLLHSLRWRGLGSADSVAFSANGETLASGQLDGTIRLWRVSDGELLHTMEGHAGGVSALAFSPDGQTVASASSDGTVRLWRLSDRALWQILEGHTDSVWSVAFSPDGQLLASGSSDGTIRL
ncbi:MAG TPA: WD40 repeat domain-containing protein, partial [Chloroflexi bacterium]|nr:WD40 repeat domain-containing protein [Chloroflexota bacterium]